MILNTILFISYWTYYFLINWVFYPYSVNVTRNGSDFEKHMSGQSSKILLALTTIIIILLVKL